MPPELLELLERLRARRSSTAVRTDPPSKADLVKALESVTSLLGLSPQSERPEGGVRGGVPATLTPEQRAIEKQMERSRVKTLKSFGVGPEGTGVGGALLGGAKRGVRNIILGPMARLQQQINRLPSPSSRERPDAPTRMLENIERQKEAEAAVSGEVHLPAQLSSILAEFGTEIAIAPGASRLMALRAPRATTGIGRIATAAVSEATKFGALEQGLSVLEGESLEEATKRGQHGVVAGAVLGGAGRAAVEGWGAAIARMGRGAARQADLPVETRRLFHFSDAPLETVDPARAGTGPLRGAERAREGRQRAGHFYTDPSKKETGLGNVLHEAKVTGAWYDNAQPNSTELDAAITRRIRSSGSTRTYDQEMRLNTKEEILKERGYVGFVDEQRGIATSFYEVPVQRVTEEARTARFVDPKPISLMGEAPQHIDPATGTPRGHGRALPREPVSLAGEARQHIDPETGLIRGRGRDQPPGLAGMLEREHLVSEEAHTAIQRAQRIVGKDEFEKLARADVAARGGGRGGALTARTNVFKRESIGTGIG
ncbi:hypothetical protein LCGC14_2178320, partial [marine sediment metagenome]